MPKPKKVVERTVSKATSRTGSDTKRGGGRTGSGGGTITISSVSPSGNVGNPVPTVRAKVAAYTCAQRINDSLNRPLRHLADLLV